MDFDGVLCDSALETGITAWRTGCQVWPEWQGLEPPNNHLDRFLRLRPVIETGYQAVLLMRLIDQGLKDSIIETSFQDLSTALIREAGQTPESLARLFGAARDAWIEQDRMDWLGRHSFYPGTLERMQEKMKTEPVFISTTKQKRFVKELIRDRGIQFPDKHLFGLDSGKSKEDLLEALSERYGSEGARVHFVEDRFQTLIRAAENKKLEQVQLYLADWGYSTDRELDQARSVQRITVWNRDNFLNV